MAPDSNVFDAVNELNRRLARSHQRQTRVTLLAAVAAGIGGAAHTSSVIGLTSRGIAVSFAFVAMGAFVVGDLCGRALLGRKKATWAAELAARFGAPANAIVEYALPFGGLPHSERRSGSRSTRNVLLAVAVGASLLAFGIVTRW